MKHLKVCQKYSAARHIFNSLLSVSSGDETLCVLHIRCLYPNIGLESIPRGKTSAPAIPHSGSC